MVHTRPSAADGAPVLGYVPSRVRPGARVVLSRAQPTVALTRVQSGVGSLVLRAASSGAVGDLHLAAAYRLRSGESSLVSHERGLSTAPATTRSPLLRSTRDRFETLTLDLCQARALDRLLVLAYSPSGAPLAWTGTLTVTTVGGAAADIPLDRAPGAGVLVPLSVYSVDGQLVLRAEGELVPGALRDACLAYGFDRISWVDPSTPLT